MFLRGRFGSLKSFMGGLAGLALTPGLVLAGVTPSNDDCSDPIAVGIGNTAFTNENATTSGPPMCAAIGKDVWFRFDCTFDGFLEVSTCGNANFDTVIGVYSGCGCSSYNLLACNDESASCDDHTSKLSLAVQAGKCYRIRIAGYNGEEGLGVLRLKVLSSENAAIANRIKTGAEEDDRFGSALAGNGRFNADASRDVLIAGPRNDTLGSNTGRVYGFTGSAMDSIYTKTGEVASDNFGYAVALTDVNGDGRDDMIIGAPYNDETAENAGRVYAYSGFDGALLWDVGGQAAGDRFGWAVASAGDVDDDGDIDVIVGAPYADAGDVNTGKAFILDGADGSIVITRNGANEGDYFGWSVSGIGDLNNDDHDDYAVGAPRNDVNGADSGRVNLYSGANGAVLKRLNGDSAGDRFGSAISGRRFNSGSNSYVLLAVGAPYNDAGGSSAGRVRVYVRNITSPGSNSCSGIICPKFTINGGNSGDRFGSSVRIGNIVGNSFADILVGAPLADLNGSKSGAVYVFNGANGALTRRYFGEAEGDQFGVTLDLAGDLNNDGAGDLIVGAPLNDAGGVDAGRAYMFFFPSGNSQLVAEAAEPELPIGELTITAKDAPGDSMADEFRPADVNLDGVVNADDLSIALGSWGSCSGCSSDIDGSGAVDTDDLTLIISAFE